MPRQCRYGGLRCDRDRNGLGPPARGCAILEHPAAGAAYSRGRPSAGPEALTAVNVVVNPGMERSISRRRATSHGEAEHPTFSPRRSLMASGLAPFSLAHRNFRRIALVRMTNILSSFVALISSLLCTSLTKVCLFFLFSSPSRSLAHALAIASGMLEDSSGSHANVRAWTSISAKKRLTGRFIAATNLQRMLPSRDRSGYNTLHTVQCCRYRTDELSYRFGRLHAR